MTQQARTCSVSPRLVHWARGNCRRGRGRLCASCYGWLPRPGSRAVPFLGSLTGGRLEAGSRRRPAIWDLRSPILLLVCFPSFWFRNRPLPIHTSRAFGPCAKGHGFIRAAARLAPDSSGASAPEARCGSLGHSCGRYLPRARTKNVSDIRSCQVRPSLSKTAQTNPSNKAAAETR